jgi:uncharacterized spore protein YtfJ
MEQLESLVKTTAGEIEKVLSADTIIGTPLSIEGATLIPLIQVGFGFGAGGGDSRGSIKQAGEGNGGGAGGGAGIKPVAMVIIDKSGVRLVTIKGGVAGVAETVAETVPKVVAQWMEKREEKKEVKK